MGDYRSQICNAVLRIGHVPSIYVASLALSNELVPKFISRESGDASPVSHL
ncbi:MAG: hypothetical protein MHMPM18_000827 [Marteilia pararefringens]